MIAFEIEKFGRTATCYSPGRVFDDLVFSFGVSDEEAIDAESWCELASVGEIYYGDKFTVEVFED